MSTAEPFRVDESVTAIRAQLQLYRSNNKKNSSRGADLAVVTTTKTLKKKAPAPAAASGSSAPAKETKDAKPAAVSAAAEEASLTQQAYDRWTLLDDATVDYGFLAKTGGKGINELPEDDKKGFYITTAINYTNGAAHIGHAYEAATSDVIARFHRLTGDYPTYFVTGSDEHGQKIANTAADQGKQPIDICDTYMTGFKVLDQRLLMSFDDYIRTTSDRHKRVAKELWQKCHASGDIYLDTYSGWYNIREETFVTDSEAALSDYKDPSSGAPLKKVEEESYFFKMSNYHDRLLKYIEDNPDFIMPDQHRNQILQRLKADQLRDLSVSRTTFAWGIPVPEGFAPNHVMYVWVDALSNYLTGVNGLRVNSIEKDHPAGTQADLHKFWPAGVHVIGKDILWFHTVIWPCLLMSAGLPLPKTVYAHGFVSDREGKKMSKSLGNVVDPHDILDKYNVDTFRWYLCKEAPYGGDLAFNEDSLRDMHNADLCDTLGNLVHRVTNLCGKYCDGKVADVPAPPQPPVNLAEVLQAYKTKMNRFELQGGANVAIQGFRDVNGYLQTEAPWLKKGDEHDLDRQITVRACLEAIYALAHLLLPFLPVGASQIFRKLHTDPVALAELGTECRNLTVGTSIEVGDVLYAKAMSEEEVKDAAAAATKKKESFAEAQKRKKEARAKAAAASNADKGDKAVDPNQPEFTKMEIRVGKITKVWNHPEADKLFCEQIDLAEESGPREIASGLRDHYSLEDMQDRKVLVVCNLKAVKMLGFTSNGMVLACKSAGGDKVELVSPPDDATVGERVFVEGLSGEPISAAQVKKRKTWETVAKDLKTNDACLATWNGKVIQTRTGPCRVPSLTGSPIS